MENFNNFPLFYGPKVPYLICRSLLGISLKQHADRKMFRCSVVSGVLLVRGVAGAWLRGPVRRIVVLPTTCLVKPPTTGASHALERWQHRPEQRPFPQYCARSQLSRSGRESVVANAHGYRSTTRTTGSTESEHEDAARRDTALSIITDGSEDSVRKSEHFLGTERLTIETLSSMALHRIQEERQPCCPRLCANAAHPPVDTMVAGTVSVSEEAEEPEHNEWRLIL
eukprot:COSAG05_NODE_7678_length_780_cov_1.707783_1_plen_225_part_10